MADRNYGAIRDVETFEKAVNACIRSGKPLGFDIEAGYTGPDGVKLALREYHPRWIFVGFSFTISPHWARYVPVAHDDSGNIDDTVETARLLWRLLMSGNTVSHNASYELTGTSRWFRELLWNDPLVGAEIRETNGMFPILDDTLVGVWLTAKYDPLRVGKDLKDVCEAAFGLKMTHFEDLFPPEDTDMGPKLAKAKRRFARFNTRNSYSQRIIDYGCEDSVACLMLHYKHRDELKDTFVFRFEMELQPVLCAMERGPVDPDTGYAQGNMVLDWDLIHTKAKEVLAFKTLMNEEILSDLSTRLNRMVNLNIGSIPQMRHILYDEFPMGLGLPISERHRSKKTKEPSTGEKALRVLAKTDPIIRKILDYKQVVKLYGSYLHKYELELDYSGTGVVFPNHNQAGALTGRMSVDHFSYQQLPKPYHYKLNSGATFDFNFRDILASPPGSRIVGFDFSQIELRVLAGVAQETTMLKAFADGIDIHRVTASTMLRIALAEVTKIFRAVGKTCNFAVVYQSGAQNIADMLTAMGTPTTLEEAIGLLERYFEGFPSLRAWMDAQIELGHKLGYVKTLFGRKYKLWEYWAAQPWVNKKGDRMCINAPIQGGAADYLKISLVRVYKAILRAEAEGRIPKDSVRLMMTVHDSMEFYVRDDVATQTVIDIVNPEVTFRVKGLPEIEADWHEGHVWGSVIDITLDPNKQIVDYTIEDVDERFSSIEVAYAYADAHKVKIEKVPFISMDDPEAIDLGSPDDEDDDDTSFVLPELDITVPQTAVITLREMPISDDWGDFQDWLNRNPGYMTVIMETPEGNVTLDTTHSLSPDDQGVISLILGGAGLAILTDPQDVDVTEGVML